jgi:hypothetical protein
LPLEREKMRRQPGEPSYRDIRPAVIASHA